MNSSVRHVHVTKHVTGYNFDIILLYRIFGYLCVENLLLYLAAANANLCVIHVINVSNTSLNPNILPTL